MQDKGYTVPELIIVIVVIGIISVIAINKASYAFVDTNAVNNETEELILIKSATAYGKSIVEELKSEDKYVTGKDLVEKEYLIDENHSYNNAKIKISYDEATDNVVVEILK